MFLGAVTSSGSRGEQDKDSTDCSTLRVVGGGKQEGE